MSKMPCFNRLVRTRKSDPLIPKIIFVNIRGGEVHRIECLHMADCSILQDCNDRWTISRKLTGVLSLQRCRESTKMTINNNSSKNNNITIVINNNKNNNNKNNSNNNKDYNNTTTATQQKNNNNK